MGEGRAKKDIQIGDLDGGGVYVGKSATDGKDLHAALADLPEHKTYEEALAAAEQLKSLHPTAHVPTVEELDVNLYQNRDTGHLKGTFNTSGDGFNSNYLASEPYSDLDARNQFFRDGSQHYGFRYYPLPVRLVW